VGGPTSRGLASGAVLLGALAAVALAGASPAPRATQSGCGGVDTAAPTHWHAGYRPPLAIGDSTMLLALPELAREGFSVNAHGCRQYPEALSLLGGLRSAGALPHLVLIALGGDGSVSSGEVEQALQVLGRGRLLVLVTPLELGGGSGANAQVVRSAGARHEAQVRVLDWVAYSAGHPSWFQPDGLHLTFPGAAAFSGFLGRVIALAEPPTPPPTPRCPAPSAGPQTRLRGLTAPPPGSVLSLRPRSSRLSVALTNANPFPVLGLARLREAGGLVSLAIRCVSLRAGARGTLTLKLPPRTLADLELGRRPAVRLELILTGPPGVSVRVGERYRLNLASR
jgi:hypothetical protein